MGAGASTNQHQSENRDKTTIDPTKSRCVLINCVRDEETTDTLKQRLEIALNHTNTVEKIVYGSTSDKVVVTFKSEVNPIFLEKFFRKESLKFIAIKEPTIVQVLRIPQGQDSLKAVLLYLRNTEAGGTPEADFYGTPDPTAGYCFIDLKNLKVIQRVCKRKHDIFSNKIYILPYYEQLGTAVNLEAKPKIQIPDTSILIGVDVEILKFIRENMESEFHNFMKNHNINNINLANTNLHSVMFTRTLSKTSSHSDDPTVIQGPDWKTRVEQAFKEFCDQLHVERLEIKDERKWRYIQETKEELCRQETAVKLYDESGPPTFKLVCRKTDKEALKLLIDNIKTIEPHEEPETDTMQGYSSLKLKAFEILGFKDDIKHNNSVDVQIIASDGKIKVIGIPMHIEAAKAEIARILGSLEETICSYPDVDYLDILNTPQLQEQCNREIENKNLRGIWEIKSEGSCKELSICYEESKEKHIPTQIKNLLFGHVDTDTIIFADNIKPESLAGLKNKIKEIENTVAPFARIKHLEHSSNVKVTCRKDLMPICKHQIQNFIRVNCTFISDIYMKAAIAHYIYDVMKSQINENFSAACGKSIEWKFKDSTFYVTGNQIDISKCTEVLSQLTSKIAVIWTSIERKGIYKYFTSSSGTNVESQFERCHLKILGKDDFRKSKIRLIALTEDGQSIAIGSRDLYKLHVDGLVNEMSEDCEPFSRGGEELMREISNYIGAKEQLTEGHVFVTGPGKLPCLKIIHAVVPTWRGGTENEDNSLEETIKKILSMAESHSLRSIAMPTIACKAKFGYATKRASGILMNTIFKHFPTRFKSVREIYICDTDSTKIQTFQRLAENLFGSHCFSIPLGQNLTFGETIAQNPNKRHKEGFQTIVKRRGIRKIPLPAGRKIIIAWGDLAKLSECIPPLKADIIVNPTTSFPDLSGDIANGLKAATRNEGKFDLELECKKKEPKGGLQKGSYVATETPHMSCDQILHLRVEDDYKSINEEVCYTEQFDDSLLILNK